MADVSRVRIFDRTDLLEPMRFIFAILLIFSLVIGLVGGIGIGIGFLVHWLVPEIGVDIGSLLGVITFIWCMQALSRFMNAYEGIQEEIEAADSEVESVIIKPVRRKHAAKRRS